MKGEDGEEGGADRAGLMRMTLKVVENRKILSFFICMQIRLLHKLTPEPRCQSSSRVEAGLPSRPLVRLARPSHTHTPYLGVSGGFGRNSQVKVEKRHSTSFVYCSQFTSKQITPRPVRAARLFQRQTFPLEAWKLMTVILKCISMMLKRH